MLSSIALVANVVALNLPRAPQPRLQVPSTTSAPPTYDTSAPWDDRTPRIVAADAQLQLEDGDSELRQLDGDDSELRVRTYSPLPAAPSSSSGAAFATRCEELAALCRGLGRGPPLDHVHQRVQARSPELLMNHHLKMVI